jgi:hypothetical protein
MGKIKLDKFKDKDTKDKDGKKVKGKAKKFKVKGEKRLRGGGDAVTLSTDDGTEIKYVESAGIVYFVGVTEPRRKLKGKTARELVNSIYNI